MKLCIALDMDSRDCNLALAREIKDSFKEKCADIWLKVGLNAFIRDGISFVQDLQNLGFRIFLDLKLYDIPNTMLNAIKEMDKLCVDMATIHASSGLKAMKSIAQYLRENNSKMKVIAVSALTSFDNEMFSQIYNASIESSVRNFANIVYKSGLDGLVCSISEVEIIKNISPSLLCVTPGIRLDSIESSDDQERIATPKIAREKGSDFIVVGRPIYHAKDKIKVIESILKEIK
ncbi:orotidine-5'-phosphate decarboxylase [Helicobacter saguini]|uniref:Orotidine 5'-phosphate decarboxylase n=1 Tax=Helicobacter saguini TaxID=1548018 RepID=A0A347VMV9_9HELI|nr:orotidine-5'-phosphate decarboxylase [Helicobacter saguini]MWV62004.1 orotidine-5'-phosphate decarboxylase [Helicobacter saguini]MWV67321.1 orotidine-5'-phosphate decarboxylase [Helicobacter saguini]MWV69674.1 orotidine-5'-phosphate decarboxylase [Helicobacter saguini]MWV73109.1 orotidine-5'-phosphate decarboxylase [Helicobacter saguini]TLD95524.1 orotidine-5'-phosphate decarboxylase [Helicobacter saguini]